MVEVIVWLVVVPLFGGVAYAGIEHMRDRARAGHRAGELHDGPCRSCDAGGQGAA